MMRKLVLALALITPALPALAEGWTIQTLGTMPSTEACMDKARIVINRYLFENKGGETASDTWSVYGFDLEPDSVDSVIMCATGGGNYVNATLVLHNEGNDRSTVANALLDFWNQ